MTNQLVFKGKTLTPVIVNNQPYLGVSQIGTALQYTNPTRLIKIYLSHADEFTPDMSFLTTIDTAGGKQQVRVFSLRGCHLLAMFSKTPVAKEFRRWVLDLIEQHNQISTLPDMKALGGMVKSCCAVAVREELEKATSDMLYIDKFKSLVEDGTHSYVTNHLMTENTLPAFRKMVKSWVKDALAEITKSKKDLSEWASQVIAGLVMAERGEVKREYEEKLKKIKELAK